MSKKCKKLFLFEYVWQFSSERSQRSWLKIFRNIVIKLATGEVTKSCTILVKNLEKFKF